MGPSSSRSPQAHSSIIHHPSSIIHHPPSIIMRGSGGAAAGTADPNGQLQPTTCRAERTKCAQSCRDNKDVATLKAYTNRGATRFVKGLWCNNSNCPMSPCPHTGVYHLANLWQPFPPPQEFRLLACSPAQQVVTWPSTSTDLTSWFASRVVMASLSKVTL